MAVLAEAISVVVRADAIHTKIDGGWATFVGLVPNRTLCADDELARVGFMHPDDVKTFVDELEKRGLRYLGDGGAIDLVVVDQQRGPLAATEWIDFGTVSLSSSSHVVPACRLKGSTLKQVVTPDGWVFEGSLSHTFSFAKSETGLDVTEVEKGLLEVKSPLWEKPMYLGRTRSDDEPA